MKRISSIVFLWVLLGSLSSTAVAASEEQLLPAASENVAAVITAPDDIAVGRTIILDGSASRSAGERVEYRWSIEETRQSIGRNVEAIYTPEKPGVLTFKLLMRSTNLQGKVEESVAFHTVIVYKRKFVVIADDSVPADKLMSHAEQAQKEGVLLSIVQPPEGTPSLLIEESLVELLGEKKGILQNADGTVLWTRSIAGLQALMRATRAESDKAAQIQSQSLLVFSEQSLTTLERTTRGSFSVLRPKEIIMTRKEAIHPLIAAASMQDFKELLSGRDIESITLTASSFGLRPWNMLSWLVNYILARGIAGQTVILLLMLPVIATIFTFLKQVIGITTFGLYTPSIVALSFLALGWWPGLLFLVFILSTGYLTRSFMRRWRLLYVPKVAIVLTVVSLSLLVLVGIGTRFGLSFSRDAVFILLILSTLAENFLNLKTEEGWWSAVIAILETILGALLCFFIVQWPSLQSLVLAYPEIVLLTLLVNIFLGRFTGLRLVEYFRFREVFKHLAQEE